MCWRYLSGAIAWLAKSIRMWNYRIYIDNAAMQLLRWPKQFDTIVTGNLFDILSDVLCSLAVLGCYHLPVYRQVGVFEPVHGSAPDIAGRIKPTPSASVECGDDATLRLESANCRRPLKVLQKF